MKNRICLWLSAIVFALSLFGCSVDVSGDNKTKPKANTSLVSVKVNDNDAIVNENGTVWTCTLYGTTSSYAITSIVATPEDASASVEYEATIASVQLGETFTTKIIVTNGNDKTTYTLNVIYSKGLLLNSVKVNDVSAKVNTDGKTWVCTVYGAAKSYEITSVVATPEDSDAVVTIKNSTGSVAFGKTFTTNITVTNGEQSTVHKLTVVYAKDYLLSRITVDKKLATASEDGLVWTCEVFGVNSEYTINSIEAIPVYNAMDVTVENPSGTIKFGETFTTKITVASEKSSLEYTLNVIYSKDLSLSGVTVNGNAAKTNEDGTIWTYKVYGTSASYEITSVIATPVDTSAKIEYEKSSGIIGFGETFTTKIAYTNGTEKRDFILNVTYSKETTVDTVEDLKAGEFEIGDVVTTRGYYSVGDGGQAVYIIQDYNYYLNEYLPFDCRKVGNKLNRIGVEYELIDTPVDEWGNHTIKNDNVACLFDPENVVAEQFGCVGDGEFDNSEPLIHLFAQRKKGKLTFKKDAIYLYPERKMENVNAKYKEKIYSTLAVPYNAYMCGRSSSNQRITMANVDGLEIDGNGATIKIADDGWNLNKMQDMAIINLYRVIRNLKIHDLTLDGNFSALRGSHGVENHGICWKAGNRSAGGSATGAPTVADGTVHEIANLEIYNCTFKNLGTSIVRNDCGGDGIIIITPTEKCRDINIHHNKFYNWGRWCLAIDLGGEGESIENLKFTDNECIQDENNVNDAGYFRGLGWIDFECRLSFKNLEVSRNYVKGSNGFAFNGNARISENVKFCDNKIERTTYGITAAGLYPYMCEWYYPHIVNLEFSRNDLSKCVAGNRLGYSVKNVTIKDNILPVTNGVLSLIRACGEILIDNNEAGDKGIAIGITGFKYPDYYTETDKKNERTKITFTNNKFGLKTRLFNEERANDIVDIVMEGNEMSHVDMAYFNSEWEFDVSQLSDYLLGGRPFAVRGATLKGFAPYNYKFRPNGGGLWDVGDVISQNETQKSVCTKAGYTRIQGELKHCDHDEDWKAGATKNQEVFIVSDNKLYVTLNTGTFGTEAPTHTSGIQLNGDVKLKYLADICEYETIKLTE